MCCMFLKNIVCFQNKKRKRKIQFQTKPCKLTKFSELLVKVLSSSICLPGSSRKIKEMQRQSRPKRNAGIS